MLSLVSFVSVVKQTQRAAGKHWLKVFFSCSNTASVGTSRHHYQGAGEGFCEYNLELADPSIVVAKLTPGDAVAVDADAPAPLPQHQPPPNIKLSYLSNIQHGQGANDDRCHCPFELFDVIWFYNVEPVISIAAPTLTDVSVKSVVGLRGGDVSRCNSSSWQWARFRRAAWESARQEAE